jgi:hypothetical protein
MSKIEKELCKACDIDASKYGNDRAGMHADIVTRVNKLPDPDWNALSKEAQDWYNAAADMTKANKANDTKKPLPEFPDYAPPEETRSRRRSADDDGDKKPAKGESLAVEKLKDGDRVKLTTKRGKVFEGTVVENNQRKEFVAVKGSDGEDEIDWDKVDSVEVFHGTAGSKEEAGPEVGDEVSFTTKRGKSVSGTITELTKDTIVIDKTDDYDLDRIDGDIKIVKKGKAGGGREEPETRSRRSSSDDKGSDDKGSSGRGRSSGGDDEQVSVGGRLRELMAKDPDRSKDDINAQLKKEGVDYRETSLNVIYRDCANLIRLLREAGHMKK